MVFLSVHSTVLLAQRNFGFRTSFSKAYYEMLLLSVDNNLIV